VIGNAERAALVDRDEQFFAALIAGDGTALESMLAPDFVLVGIADGAVVDRAGLLAAVRSGALAFIAIDAFPDEAVVRRVGTVGIVVGRTAMSFTGPDGLTQASASRYTHVYRRDGDEWLMFSAQGTQIR
jgi:ketosteroid isomerase-like protein